MNKSISIMKFDESFANSLIYSLERRFKGTSFKYDSAAGAVHFEAESEASALEIEKFAAEYVGRLQGPAGRIKSRLYWSRQSEATNAFDHDRATDELILSDRTPPGVVTAGSSIASLFAELDELFRRFALSQGAEDISVPSLITTESLQRAGYLPREVHQVGEIHTCDSADGFRSSGAALTPAACLPLYPVAHRLVEASPAKFTFPNKVFRRESGRFTSEHPMGRLWEFRVREIVFFTDPSAVEPARQSYMEFLKDVCTSLDLPCEIRTSTDAFFHPDHARMAFHQLLHESKVECLFTGKDQKLALSSFNVHGSHFTNAFEIYPASSRMVSFCIGFGIERWASAALQRYRDPAEAIEILRRSRRMMEAGCER